MSKLNAGLGLIVALLFILTANVQAAVIYVPDDYPTIQQAVNAANEGDTIIVRDGTYVENIDVDKSLTIRSENGSDNCIIQALDLGDYVFEVTADYVNISGFIIESENYGIYISSSFNTITDCNFSYSAGILLYYYSTNNTISNCKILGGDVYLMEGSNYNTISNCSISDSIYGITIEYSSNNLILNNKVSSSDTCIGLLDSDNNSIVNNTCENCDIGFMLEFSDNNIFYKNNILKNGYGIYLDTSNNNMFFLNNFKDNNGQIYIPFDSSTNIWNSTQPITYTYNGQQFTNYLGNYWDDYAGSDADGDGIGDTPYTIDSQNKDYHALIAPKENYRLPIYVPDDYPTIQQAVDAANEGDTIIVRDGTYVENIDVDKSLTIMSENGSTNCIVEAADSSDHVFYITADWVTISGFTITGASNYATGIYINADNSCIAGNNVSGNWRGIYLYLSNNNQITNNEISENHENGVYLALSYNNQITNNEISRNGAYGIYLHRSNNNQITNNEISRHELSGIRTYYSNNNQITNNEIFENGFDGIESYYSSNNQITNNEIFGNHGAGVYLYLSNNNQIYLNNFVRNYPNAFPLNSTNIWNSTQPITYTYNSQWFTNYLGNYWSDYTGSDADGDGIGDTPYQIDSDADFYPLMQPFENYSILSDKDGDGVPDSQEAGDWNNDGIDDAQQSNVATITTENYKVTFYSQDNVFSDVKAENLSAFPPPPASLPYGLYSFNLSVTPGSTVQITVYVYDSNGNAIDLDPNTEYWKYTSNGNGNPSGQPGWYNIPSTVSGNTIVFTLTDGGVGDFDGVANGVISDPGGPGISIQQPIPELNTIGLIVASVLIILLLLRIKVF